MTENRRKAFYWLFKITSIIISCLFPIWAICERFPIWTEQHGTGHSIGVGAILILFVLVVIFRKTIFDYIQARFGLMHAPPLAVWFVMLIISYILVYLGNVMRDMTIVFWMGLIGCAIGTLLTFIAENRFGGVKKDD